MSKKVKYLAYAIAVVLVTGIMTVAIWAATSATAGISANVSWTATEGITFELEAWVVNNASANGIGATTVPKSISKQIVTASTSNTAANNLAGDLACGFYDGSNDGVNNPSNIVFTYKIKNTGSGILKVTATKTPTNSAESGTTAANHKPAVALSSKLDSTDNTSSCISSITGNGFNIPADKTLEYIVTLSISNADLSITNYDAGVTFSFGTLTAGTPTIYVNGVQQSSPGIDGATTVGDYLDALDGSQYPGYFYDEDLTIYAGEDDIVTNDTKLYTKSATLDKLKFISNGDGTCSVEALDYKFGGEVVIPKVSSLGDIVTSMGKHAFAECSLKSIIIPNSVTSIGYNAIGLCFYLERITIPDSVTSIGDSAFSACGSLTSITIPDSVTSIGEKAFVGCSGLTSIYIPSSVTTITAASSSTYSPFYNCSSSLKIYCGASSKPSGWGTHWNYYSSSATTLSVTWGVTRDQYNSQYA